ncbi:hypothetical protein B0O99DRAFT_588910 [Bisporella sp. PMI_857]|nr:hypothetical protein B0O99DRAFT_588910 [Bisporella sp. PMI_857]
MAGSFDKVERSEVAFFISDFDACERIGTGKPMSPPPRVHSERRKVTCGGSRGRIRPLDYCVPFFVYCFTSIPPPLFWKITEVIEHFAVDEKARKEIYINTSRDIQQARQPPSYIASTHNKAFWFSPLLSQGTSLSSDKGIKELSVVIPDRNQPAPRST